MFFMHDILLANAVLLFSRQVGCHRLYCPTNMEPRHGKCIEAENTASGQILDLVFEVNITVHSTSFMVNFYNLIDNALEMDNYTTLESLGEPWYNFSQNEIIFGKNLTSGWPCTVILLRVPLEDRINMWKRKEEKEMITKIFANYTVTFPNNVLARHLHTIETASCHCNEYIKDPMYLTSPLLIGNQVPCPAVKVRYHEKDIDTQNHTLWNITDDLPNENLYYELNGVIIKLEDIRNINGISLICVETYLSKYQNVDFSGLDYRFIINTTCSCVSIICLFFSLVNCCVFEFMRNKGVHLLIGLFVFLLLSQICFLIIPPLRSFGMLCEWLGVFHHFLWLGTFVFMFLCSFRMNFDIRNLQGQTKEEAFAVTLKYYAAGIVFPLVTVLCTKIVNMITTQNAKWYGGDICFISDALVLLISFLVPISLILSGNIILFVLIVHYITSTSVPTSTNAHKSKVILYMKISTMMGFGWIVGIVAMLTKSEVLLFIFEILTGLQGMFITFGFTCNQRVRDAYRNRFKPKQITPSDPKVTECRPVAS